VAVGVCQRVCLRMLCKQLPWTAAAAAAAAVRACGQWAVHLILGGRLHTAAAAAAAAAAVG
jgi:hypothetical protein